MVSKGGSKRWLMDAPIAFDEQPSRRLIMYAQLTGFEPKHLWFQTGNGRRNTHTMPTHSTKGTVDNTRLQNNLTVAI